jgi:hypothetical protein
MVHDTCLVSLLIAKRHRIRASERSPLVLTFATITDRIYPELAADCLILKIVILARGAMKLYAENYNYNQATTAYTCSKL